MSQHINNNAHYSSLIRLLYPDSQERFNAVVKLSNLFDTIHYPKTAIAIRALSGLLLKEEIPDDFFETYTSLFETLKSEFKSRIPIGSQFRELCLDEITKLVFLSIEKIGVSRFSNDILEIYPTLLTLNQSKKLVSEIAEFIGSEKRLGDKIIFHLNCYAYVVIVEGTFDELSRIVYFLTNLANGVVVKGQELDQLKVWNIYDKLKPTPVFLTNWEEKKNIRDAIGHASSYYNDSTNEIRFVNNYRNRHYDKTMPVTKFYELLSEMESSVNAFIFVMLLLKIIDYFFAKEPFR